MTWHCLVTAETRNLYLLMVKQVMHINPNILEKTPMNLHRVIIW